MKRWSMLIPFLIVTSCAHCPVSGSNPYNVARAVIQAAQLALNVAAGVFASFGSPSSQPQFIQISTAVADGLKLALDGVNVAEEQKSGFDLNKLMANAESSYQDLRAFLTALQGRSGPTTKRGLRQFTVKDLPPTLLPPPRGSV